MAARWLNMKQLHEQAVIQLLDKGVVSLNVPVRTESLYKNRFGALWRHITGNSGKFPKIRKNLKDLIERNVVLVQIQKCLATHKK